MPGFRAEVAEICEKLNIWKPSIGTSQTGLNLNMKELRDKVTEHERAITAFLGAGGAGGLPGFGGKFGSTGVSPQGRRANGLEVRIPDPRNWVLDVLQNGDTDWYAWRKSFGLPVRSVWGDLDKLLVEMKEFR